MSTLSVASISVGVTFSSVRTAPKQRAGHGMIRPPLDASIYHWSMSVIPGNPTLELLARHVGIWEGKYTHIDPQDRSVQEELEFRIRVECPAPDGTAYRQTSRYRRAGGHEEELVYGGRAVGDRVVFDTGRIRGECWKIDADALYLWFAFAEAPSGRITEMIQLSQDGRHRARTWHWFQDEKLWRVTLVRETRVSLDPADWDRPTIARV